MPVLTKNENARRNPAATKKSQKKFEKQVKRQVKKIMKKPAASGKRDPPPGPISDDNSSMCDGPSSGDDVRKQRKAFKAKKAPKKNDPSSSVHQLPPHILEHFERLKRMAKETSLNRNQVRLNLRKKLRVASDCAGMASDLLALGLCGFGEDRVETTHWSENDQDKRSLYRFVCKALGLHVSGCCPDMTVRDVNTSPGCDLYVAGWPCPSFSNLGKGKGVADKRGQVGLFGLEYIVRHVPAVVLLENVKALLDKKHKPFLNKVIEILKILGYDVHVGVLDTKDFGVPHPRNRVYLVAIKESDLKVPFEWPEQLDFSKKHLGQFLNIKVVGKEKCNIKNYIKKYGADIQQQQYILDVHASKKFQSTKRYVCPCLTRSRLKVAGTGYYIPKLQRRLSIQEAARFQGWPDQLIDSMQQKFTDQVIGGALGDSMSINVLAKVLLRALRSINFIENDWEVKDRGPWFLVEDTYCASTDAWQRWYT